MVKRSTLLTLNNLSRKAYFYMSKTTGVFGTTPLNQYLFGSDFKEQMYKSIEAQKKISKAIDQSEFYRLIDFIVLFNSLSENIRFLWYQSLDDIPVLDEFKDFIFPNSVRYEGGNRMFKDILIRTQAPFDSNVDRFNEYLNLLSKLRGTFKKDISSGYVSLSSLRVDRSFEQVRSIAAFPVSDSFQVRYESSSFIPIYLSQGQEMFTSVYLNANESDVIDDYLAKIIF